MKITIQNIAEWQDVTDKIKPLLTKKILTLKGNLGAGKTTFSQFLVKSLGSQDTVTSPTYSIVNEYKSQTGIIFHFDLYRLKSIEEAFDFGIEEYLESGNFCIIEWPQIYEEELQHYDHHEINITNTETGREIEFN